MAKKALGRGLGAIFGDDLHALGQRSINKAVKPAVKTVEEEVVAVGSSASPKTVEQSFFEKQTESDANRTSKISLTSQTLHSASGSETKNYNLPETETNQAVESKIFGTEESSTAVSNHTERQTSGTMDDGVETMVNAPNEIQQSAHFTDESVALKEAKATAASTKDVSRETYVSLSRIEPNRSQPRKKFDEESLQELAASMKRFGILQPLLVKQKGLMYEIIAGERRWRAAKLAGLTEVPVIVRSFDEQTSAEIAIIENIQREDLGPIEEARAYQSLIKEYGLTQEEVAEHVSKNRSTITNSLRLLQLTERVLALLSDGKLSAGHARALLMISDPVVQEQLAEEIVERHLSVRDAERLAKAAAKAKKKEASEEEQELNMYLIDAARKLTEHLGTKVQIRQGARGKGKVEIEYYNNDDLNKILDILRSE